jgi:hypothetical protein
VGTHFVAHINCQLHKSYYAVFSQRVQISEGHSLHAYLQSVKMFFCHRFVPTLRNFTVAGSLSLTSMFLQLPLIGAIIIMSDEGSQIG